MVELSSAAYWTGWHILECLLVDVKTEKWSKLHSLQTGITMTLTMKIMGRNLFRRKLSKAKNVKIQYNTRSF